MNPWKISDDDNNSKLEDINNINDDLLTYLIKLVKSEGNLLARDIIFYNFFDKIYDLIKIKFYKNYLNFPIEEKELGTISFLAINSAIKTYIIDKKVPFDYYVKFHSLMFFANYIFKIKRKQKAKWNNFIWEKNSWMFNFKDETGWTPDQYTNWKIIVEEIQKILCKLPKKERNAILLKLEGYSIKQITKLVNVRPHRMRYIIEDIRKQFIKSGIKEMIEF